MADGARLAATLYLPGGRGPWPAVLEALPYRKDDITNYYDAEYRRIAEEGGYAVCRVDVRGTGSSEGLASDEYPPQEQDDLGEVIGWLASRDWCTGSVGMYGTSYSGFNSLQVAMKRPPALKAIISIFATDSRYTDDVHYGGGALRGIDLVDYPSYMVAMNALPPSPPVFGDGWREQWEKRVEGAVPWLINWLENQDENDYWMQGSLKADYGSIGCPVFVVAGWADGYHNMAFRTLENVKPFSKLLAGPWSHMDPATSIPGPHIDLVPEMIRWWDRWLKGIDNGVDHEPRIQVFMRRPTRPEPDLKIHRGEWRQEPDWPVARGTEVARTLGEGTDELEIRGDIGSYGSIWCAGTLPWGPPMDQRPDEIHSLVYDWGPLGDEVEILGHPRLEVTLSSSVPVAYLSAKLCDVFPDGTSALVSRGILNLTHRDSHSDPEPLEPGRAYGVTLELDATAWIFEEGHGIRLDLAGSDWPSSWAPPFAGTLAIDRSSSRLVLPELHGPAIAPPPEFREPRRGSKGHDLDETAVAPVVWRLEHDVLARERRVAVRSGTPMDEAADPPQEDRYEGTITVSTVDPANSSCVAHSAFTIKWPEATVSSEVRTSLRSDAKTYHLDIELRVAEGGETKWTRRWGRSFPRRLQ